MVKPVSQAIDDKTAALMEMLAKVPLFESLGDDVRQSVVDTGRTVRLKAGQWLFREKSAGDALYLVFSGRLEVISEARGTPRLIAILGQGECVGELALLCELPRSASVRARRDCELLEVSRETFAKLMASDPRLAIAMTKVLATRLHRTSTRSDQAQRGKMRVLSVIPLHQGLPLHDVRKHLTDYFSQAGSVAVLDGSEVRARKLTPERAEVAYARQLDKVEGSTDLVLLLADPGVPDSNWTRFCSRQGDRQLLLTSVDAPLDLAHAHRDLDQPELGLFVHKRRRGAVMPWLDAVSPRNHHLIFDAQPTGDIHRMARKLAGRSVGVVLSGGGARGFAHVGVLDELQRLGVVVDRVGGTSIGALMAGLFALGHSIEEIEHICVHQLQSPFNDYTLPVMSLTRGRKALRFLERLFGDALIEELPMSLFCLSADLLTAQPFIHRDGELVSAIACSAALPGLTPPRRFRNRLLVDGALLNNLPTDIMASTQEGPVIASDVMAKKDDEAAADGRLPGVRPPPRWLSSLSRYLGNQRGPLPTIVQTLMRSSVLGSVNAANAQRALADIVIMPKVSHIGLLEFARGTELFGAGRRAARAAAEAHGLV